MDFINNRLSINSVQLVCLVILKIAIKSIFLKIINYTPEVTTAVVWLLDQADNEVHEKEYERFLVAEGTCTVTAGTNLFHLQPNDYYEVPLHTPHTIQVTSSQPCKVILQRVAVS